MNYLSTYLTAPLKHRDLGLGISEAMFTFWCLYPRISEANLHVCADFHLSYP